MSLRVQSMSAVRWTSISATLRTFAQLAQVVVIARLIAPGDFGLMAMASVVIGLAAHFSDLGLNSAYVQKQDMTSAVRSSLFWLNALLGASVSLALILGSWSIANFVFADPRLTLVLALLAPVFMINALGANFRASAEKSLDFKALAGIELLSVATGLIVAVSLALLQFGVYALVFSALAVALTSLVLSWCLLGRAWVPEARLRVQELRGLLRFGGTATAVNVVNQIASSLDILIGGRLLGADAIGLYSLPRNLILQIQNTINPIVTRVGFPLIAKVQQDVAMVRAIYLKSIAMTASTNAPLYVGIAVFAPEIVVVLFGARWQGSGELMRILAVWGAARSIGNPVGSLLFGIGRANLSLRWNIAMLIVAVPVVSLAALHDVRWLSIAMALLLVGMFLPMWYFLVRPLCRAGLAEYSRAALMPYVLAVVAVLPALSLRLAGLAEAPLIAFAALLTAAAYVLLSYRFNRNWFELCRQLLFGWLRGAQPR